MANQTASNHHHIRHDIECLRVVCTFGIVWFHAQGTPFNSVGHAALIAFLSLSSFLSDNSKLDFKTRVQNRFMRLMVPWFCWFLIYSIFIDPVNLPIGKSVMDTVNWVLRGPSVHLWYLPFVFVGLNLLDLLECWLGHNVFLVLCVGGAAAILAMSPVWGEHTKVWPSPWRHYLYGLAALLIGPAFRHINWHPSLFGRLAMILWIAFTAIAASSDLRVEYLLGSFALVLIASRRLAKVNLPAATELGKYAYGTYLCHVLCLRLAIRIHPEEPSLQAITAWCLAMALTVLLSRLPKAVSVRLI